MLTNHLIYCVIKVYVVEGVDDDSRRGEEEEHHEQDEVNEERLGPPVPSRHGQVLPAMQES